jgi:hypothetical protein
VDKCPRAVPDTFLYFVMLLIHTNYKTICKKDLMFCLMTGLSSGV